MLFYHGVDSGDGNDGDVDCHSNTDDFNCGGWFFPQVTS